MNRERKKGMIKRSFRSGLLNVMAGLKKQRKKGLGGDRHEE